MMTDTSESPVLIILLHAYSNNAARLIPLQHHAAKLFPKAEFYRPELPVGVLSMRDPNSIVRDQLSEIDAIVNRAEKAGRPYSNIIFVGHSLGALLARKIYVVACGEHPLCPFEMSYSPLDRAGRAWAGKVTRLILYAGINRGWRISHHLGWRRTIQWSIGSILSDLCYLSTGRRLLVGTFRRGAEFITQLRLQWIRMRERAKDVTHLGSATTIQLLGSVDDIVAPEDNVDLVSGREFYYFDVRYSDHGNVVDINDPVHGEHRTSKFTMALQMTNLELASRSIVPSDENFQQADYSIRHVVFVIHGIRDAGYWTHKIARKVKEAAGTNMASWATETSSYGYFPMLPFLFSRYRREKVEWLMDQYAEAVARYPVATMSYVGHSNGTYLLAKAIELYPGCQFENVVFAGSVANTRYDWMQHINATPPRVKKVLNFVASADWVVAFFPNGFEFLGSRDLGGAGHLGFCSAATHGPVHQVRYISGRHFCAIEESQWDVIAHFIVHGEVANKVPNQTSKRSLFVHLIGRFPPAAWLAGILIVASGFAGVWYLFSGCSWEPSYWTGIAVLLYFFVIWKLVTKF